MVMVMLMVMENQYQWKRFDDDDVRATQRFADDDSNNKYNNKYKNISNYHIDHIYNLTKSV